MLVTILEIVAFMVAATVLGLLLGWVLRGMFGKEQAEISDVRAQLRKLKRAQREQEAASQEKAAKEVKSSKEEKAVTVDVVSTASQSTRSVSEKASDSGTAAKPASKQTKVNKPQAKKQANAKKASPKAKKKNSGSRKTIAEREVDQAVARQAFAEVAERIGQSDVQDNLTKIYGVGKRYAEMLNELGLSSYAQIAKLRKADVQTLAGALGVLDDRLKTEDWVGSAKSLAKAAKK